MASDTIERLAQQFRNNRTRFNAFCMSLSDEELNRPVPNSTYRVKDFATHLATLDPELQTALFARVLSADGSERSAAIVRAFAANSGVIATTSVSLALAPSG